MTELEIDRIVVAQADDDAAWEKPVRVQRAKPAPLMLPPDLAAYGQNITVDDTDEC